MLIQDTPVDLHEFSTKNHASEVEVLTWLIAQIARLSTAIDVPDR